MSAPPPSTGRNRAFTLPELLVAMAVLAMLVTAMFSFVFSMTEIWGRGGEKRLFEQHVNAVTRHVESLLRRAAWPRGGVALDEPFSVQEIRPAEGSSANLLTFDLQDGDRLLDWPGPPLPEVRCSLGVDSTRGLVLYWQSELETDWQEEPPRTAIISPFVTSIEYAFSDSTLSTWHTDTNLSKNSDGAWVLPDRVILVFKHGDFEARRELTLPLSGGTRVF
jgi:prepilin-type N-terminal cleavage/methylation domain-containing protein